MQHNDLDFNLFKQVFVVNKVFNLFLTVKIVLRFNNFLTRYLMCSVNTSEKGLNFKFFKDQGISGPLPPQ